MPGRRSPSGYGASSADSTKVPGRRKASVRFTANFEENLDAIELFLAEADQAAAFLTLLELLGSRVIPNLEKFPGIGRPFLEHRAGSAEGEFALSTLRRRLGGAALREYLTGDYLILYTTQDEMVHLLSIKHHRQLSFDLGIHWR